jgi:tRNA pseudouridine38-40 synthase
MSRYFLTIRYDGSVYCGWQRQPNGVSVQSRIELALSRVLRSEVQVVGSGRTDAGVHASGMVAHFDYAGDLIAPPRHPVPQVGGSPLDSGSPNAVCDNVEFCRRVNGALPLDISVVGIESVPEGKHARYDAVSRTYRYVITDIKDPFNRLYVCQMPCSGFDFSILNAACDILLEYNDFTSFSKLHTDVKTNLCHIYAAHWDREGELWVFTIRANRFLRGMVRLIVGTMFELGRGRLTLEGFRSVIESRDGSLAGSAAPARGLTLLKVCY